MSSYWDDLFEKFDIKPAKGKVLDYYGDRLETPRKRYLFIFKEPDYFYRKRLVKLMRGE